MTSGGLAAAFSATAHTRRSRRALVSVRNHSPRTSLPDHVLLPSPSYRFGNQSQPQLPVFLHLVVASLGTSCIGRGTHRPSAFVPFGLTPSVPETPTTTKRIQSNKLRDPWLAAITPRKLHTLLNQRGSPSFSYISRHRFPPASLGHFSAVEWARSAAMRSASPVGSHSASESMRVATCFTCCDRTWPWECPPAPVSPLEDPFFRSSISLGSGGWSS